ncbi:hypothetical protein BOX15_Mlig010388g3, partial [Macrostomum lignano]
NSSKASAAVSGATVWYQTVLKVSGKSRGCHYITDLIKSVPEIAKIKIGTVNLLLQHTSASLCLNESWDASVKTDMEMILNRLVPEDQRYQHSCEGPDDMPAHAKAAILGCSLTIPISNGQMCLGTWQGIWLCEHRNHKSSRNIVVTVNGVEK